MIYLQVESLSKSYNDKPLFENLSFGVHKGQKIALIAKNGTGKTTLLRIIATKETPDSGSVICRNDLKIGYLEQNPVFDENLSIIEGIFDTSNPDTLLIKEYEQALAHNDKDRLTELTDMISQKNLWDYEARIKQILSELKIDNVDQKISSLSGGQKKRVALAMVLISEPELVILDEPTNHLDIEMISWLEKHLTTAHFTLLIVTHDRYFLDRVCNDIIELDQGKLYRYKGNYSYFLEKRNERIENENTVIDKAKNIFRKELEWMRQTPQARTGKSKSRIDSFYDIKEIASSKKTENKVKLNVKSVRMGKKIMEINYISKSYDDLKLLDNFTYIFKPGEKIGIIGPNGCGKTTLLDILTGITKPDKGNVDIGETVSMGYYKQKGIVFNDEQRVIDIAKEIAEVVVMSHGSKISVSEFLRQFLFTNEMQYTQVSKLSGGERRRLYLMTVLMKNPNFLILDEPTNDLDIMTLNVLEEFLVNFNGCVIMVSHDRFFIDKIAQHLFVFEENNVVKDFPGNYTQYLIYKEKINKSQRKAFTVTDIKKSEKNKNNIEKPIKRTYKEQKEFEALEIEINHLEEEKRTLENMLYSGTLIHDEVLEKSNRLGEVIRIIDEKSDRWIELDMVEE